MRQLYEVIKEMVRAIRDKEGITRSELIDIVVVNAYKAKRILNSLVDDDIVIVEMDKYYYITERGRELLNDRQ